MATFTVLFHGAPGTTPITSTTLFAYKSDSRQHSGQRWRD
jgi:hypothetical protein